MAGEVQRRDFLAALGVTAGTAALGVVGSGATAEAAETKEPAKGKIPDKPIKIGHMTFFTGPRAVLGDPRTKATFWRPYCPRLVSYPRFRELLPCALVPLGPGILGQS